MPIDTPLRDLMNSSVLLEIPGVNGLVNGRYQSTGGEVRYLIRSYLQRIEGRGTSDGRQNTFGSDETTGGGATSAYLLRGYAIEFSVVLPGFEHGVTDESSLTYTSILTPDLSPVLAIPIKNRLACTIRHGDYPQIFQGKLINIGGKYQGQGPDRTIYYELKGIPIALDASEEVS